ncbi:Putative odorant receptor 92a [Frankliniella fusca]|uniref:Odorant receptor n=1 Tax=Frankliniella fusca TaxID=407009 RepID=A0AAE1LF05_9NEOP|nr:Putative odorant receptor 92a [Frankliniella fusca]
MDGDELSVDESVDLNARLDDAESDFDGDDEDVHREPAYAVSRYVRRARNVLMGAWGKHPHGQVVHVLIAATRAPLMRPLAVLQASLSVVQAARHVLDRDAIALMPLIIDLVWLSGVWSLSATTPTFVPAFVAWLERVEGVVTELERTVSPEHARDLRLRMRLGRTLFIFSFLNMGSLALAMVIAPLIHKQAFFGVLPHGGAYGTAFFAEYAVLTYTLLPMALSIVLKQCCHAEGGTKIVAMYRMLHNDILAARSLAQVRRCARLHSQVLILSKELNDLYGPFLSAVYFGGNAGVMVCALQTLFDGPTTRGVLTCITAAMSYAWLCVLGEKLSGGSGGLVSAVHRCDWLLLDPAARKTLVFLLKRAQRCDSVRPRFVGDMTFNFFMNTVIMWYQEVQFIYQVLSKDRGRRMNNT